jgi:hypothetical protein
VKVQSGNNKLRWNEQRINEWYARKGWLIGCNYIPSTAINQVEMWQRDTFDPETIRKELGWAAKLGFNSIRVFLHDLVWKSDPDGLLARMDQFLTICSGYGIGVMFVIFDAVWDPFPSTQKREPKPFVHNSGWLQSPGAVILKDSNRQDELEDYVKSVIRSFADDDRIHVWDLFNEPDNLNPTSYLSFEPGNKSELSMRLLTKTFQWAREINPSQPLTAGLWYGDWSDSETMKAMDRFMVLESDIITFHNYDPPHEMEARIQYLKAYNRPVLCTEYMARTFHCTFQAILPLFRKDNIGAYNWGFVDGRSQTSCPWDSWLTPYEKEPELWFHDIFRKDGSPYIDDEVEFIRSVTGIKIFSIVESQQKN